MTLNLVTDSIQEERPTYLINATVTSCYCCSSSKTKVIYFTFHPCSFQPTLVLSIQGLTPQVFVSVQMSCAIILLVGHPLDKSETKFQRPTTHTQPRKHQMNIISEKRQQFNVHVAISWLVWVVASQDAETSSDSETYQEGGQHHYNDHNCAG